jgi:transposase
MLTLPSSVKIFLATAPVDMRKSHDGLAAAVRRQLGQDEFSGHLFVFMSRSRDRVKILCWERGGFVLWYKRLEKNRFRMPTFEGEGTSLELDAGQLTMLLDGVDMNRVHRASFWKPHGDWAKTTKEARVV